MQTNAIILLLAVQAALLTRDVYRLLVRPIERLAEHLRPVLSDAIRFLSEDGNRWNVDIGKQDGEELSTKLMLAAIESLRSQMKDDAKKRFDRKSLFHGLRRQSAKVGGMKTMFEGLHRASAASFNKGRIPTTGSGKSDMGTIGGTTSNKSPSAAKSPNGRASRRAAKRRSQGAVAERSASDVMQ